MSCITKMRVSDVTKSLYGTNARMHPVYEQNGVNKAWNDATPGGSCEVQIAKGKSAENCFAPGDELYVVFFKKAELPADLASIVDAFENPPPPAAEAIEAIEPTPKNA